jgi:hypothetical protein
LALEEMNSICWVEEDSCSQEAIYDSSQMLGVEALQQPNGLLLQTAKYFCEHIARTSPSRPQGTKAQETISKPS